MVTLPTRRTWRAGPRIRMARGLKIEWGIRAAASPGPEPSWILDKIHRPCSSTAIWRGAWLDGFWARSMILGRAAGRPKATIRPNPCLPAARGATANANPHHARARMDHGRLSRGSQARICGCPSLGARPSGALAILLLVSLLPVALLPRDFVTDQRARRSSLHVL